MESAAALLRLGCINLGASGEVRFNPAYRTREVTWVAALAVRIWPCPWLRKTRGCESRHWEATKSAVPNDFNNLTPPERHRFWDRFGLVVGMPPPTVEQCAATPDRFMLGRRDPESGQHGRSIQLLMPGPEYVEAVRRLRQQLDGRPGFWLQIGGLKLKVALASDPRPPPRSVGPTGKRQGGLSGEGEPKRPKGPAGFVHS